jgi:hypothetical protein
VECSPPRCIVLRGKKMSIPTREEMITALTEDMFDAMECNAEYRWAICKEGHKGFDNMSDTELEDEWATIFDEENEDA